MTARELIDKLNKWSHEYYTLDNPTVSDAEYDKVYDELLRIEKETGIVEKDSPTRRVGGAVLKGFDTYKHRARLYSLDKCKTEDEIVSYLNKLGSVGQFSVEYKYDGLTINLTYEAGYFVRATTRGDGVIGEDVTAQILTVKNVPLKITDTGIYEIQGEAIMRLSALARYNKTATEPLKNARNAVAGAVRNLDPSETRKRAPEVICYNVGYADDRVFASQSEMREFLKRNGFTVGEFELKDEKDAILDVLKRIEERRENLDFLIDGAVIKVNDTKVQEKLGYTEKFPRWAMAYKFRAEEMTTTVRDCVWQVSRTGKLNPLAILDPVDIGGVTVKKATLNNYSEILRKGIKLGARVFVRRSNDVIPEILGVAEYTEESCDIPKPTTCPVCGAPVRYDDVFIYCTNETTCVSRIVSALEHFASKDCLDIEGLSEKTLEQLHVDLGVKRFTDLYALTKEQLLTLDGFKEKKAKNLVKAISDSKVTELWRFIHALGIPGIGKKASKQLSDVYATIDDLRQATVEELVTIDDFGEITARNVVEYFSNEESAGQVNSLLSLGFEFSRATSSEGVFSGEVVVVTGTLANYKRSVAQEMISSRGGEVADSVSKRVTLVIAGESAGSKLDKAKSLGIKVINEEEFEKLLNE